MHDATLHSSPTPHTPAPSPIIVGVDIGTTKIVVIAARKNEQGLIEILGFGKAASRGVSKALVLNLRATRESIQEAMQKAAIDARKKAAKRAGVAESDIPMPVFQDVYVSVAGSHIHSMQSSGTLLRSNPLEEISEREVAQLTEDQWNKSIPASHHIVQVVPQHYFVDGNETLRAVGCNGNELRANFQIITAEQKACSNIVSAVEKAGLRIQDLELQPLASAYAIVTPEDLEAGVVVIDIGGGTTDIAVFHRNVLRYTGSIPLGGRIITDDIKDTFMLIERYAEQLKIQFGSALSEKMPEDEYISMPPQNGLSEPTNISVKKLAHTIQGRMERILECVDSLLNQLGIPEKELSGGIIITGGGAQLKHMEELVAYKTRLLPRIGKPTRHLAKGYDKELEKTEYATSVGLLIRGFKDYEQNLHIESESGALHPALNSEESSNISPLAEETLTSENGSGAQNMEHNPETPTAVNTDMPPTALTQSRNGNLFTKIKTNMVGMLDQLFGSEEDEKLH